MPKSTCLWPECESPARTRNYCSRDYYRAKTEGNFIDPWLTWVDKTHMTRAGRKPSGAPCAWPECADRAKSNGMCLMHYGRGFRLGNIVDPWLTWQRHPNCIVCGGAFQATRSTHQYCSQECNMSRWIANNADRYREMCARASSVRRAREASLPSENFTMAEIRASSGESCYLCGDAIDFDLRYPDRLSPSIDHIVPISRGGGHVLSNVAMTHLACNIRKGAREPRRSLPAVSTN